MDRDRIITGVFYYDGSLKNEKDIKNLAGCGADVVVATSAEKEFLDLCEKNGIGVITNSTFPLWWGGTGENAGKYADSFALEKLESEKARPEIMNHPALWGDYPCDEPHSADFGHLGKVVGKYSELYPEKLCFVNLYPIYANTAPRGEVMTTEENLFTQLGNHSYSEHVGDYVDKVETDYICFDNYPFTGPFGSYLENMDIVSSACRRDFRDMWIIIQSGAWTEDKILSEFQIRWQCAAALAYGAEMIVHASYSPGWWHEKTSMVDKNGNFNPTYGYVKKINAELKEFSPVFKDYSNICVLPAGNISASCPEIRAQLEAQAERNDFFEGIEDIKDIRSDGALLAGYFEKYNGDGRAVLLVNTTNPFDADAAAETEIEVQDKKLVSVYIDGHETVHLSREGKVKFSLTSGSFAFVAVRKNRGL